MKFEFFWYWWLKFASSRSQKSASKKLKYRVKYFWKCSKACSKRTKKVNLIKTFKCKHTFMLNSSERFCKTFLAMFCLSTYLQWFVSYCRKIAEQDHISASAVPKITFSQPWSKQYVFKLSTIKQTLCLV